LPIWTLFALPLACEAIARNIRLIRRDTQDAEFARRVLENGQSTAYIEAFSELRHGPTASEHPNVADVPGRTIRVERDAR